MKPWVIAVIIVTLLLVAAGFYLSSQPPPPPSQRRRSDAWKADVTGPGVKPARVRLEPSSPDR